MVMIPVTRLDDSQYYVNHLLIETMEERPDTVLRFQNDKKLIVKEKSAEIIQRIIEFNRRIYLEKHRVE